MNILLIVIYSAVLVTSVVGAALAIHFQHAKALVVFVLLLMVAFFFIAEWLIDEFEGDDDGSRSQQSNSNR